jgi:hypothetical protein
LTTELPFQGTYPADDNFWISGAAADSYPLRYGDLFRTPDSAALRTTKGRPWTAVMALHPNCELGAKGAPDGIQVIRVHRLREVSNSQQDEVRAGFRQTESGIQPARVNMVYLAPPPCQDLAEELYADLRQTARVDNEIIPAESRLAVMSHDARLALLRRDIYFRYRWDIELTQLVELEAGRIRADQKYEGPRPSWAQ